MDNSDHYMSRDRLDAIKRFYEVGEIDKKDVLALIQHVNATMKYGESLDFARLQEEVKVWSEWNFPSNTPDHPLKGIGEEYGELLHANLKYLQRIRGISYEDYVEKAEDAIADIIIYMADFCARSGFNMQKAVERTWPQVRARDWQRYPKNGVSE